jgi:myo-inositol-1(or 4)-monophosphatase
VSDDAPADPNRPWPRKLQIAAQIAREAGLILLEGWERRPTVEFKSTDRDLVTEFDRRSEALIVARLREAFPEDAIVGEEGTSQAAAAPGAGSGTWYVDPLDGTVNFSHGLPLFCVSIGLQLPGGPALGVVHAPAVNWTFLGAPGHGATRNGRPIAPSAALTLDRGLLVTGFPTARTERAANTPAFLAYNQVAEGLRRLGSAALDLCFVACGWLDGTWQRQLHPWDTVGGAAVLLAAGGTLTGLGGGAFDPLDGGVVASNGHIHAEMLAVLTALRS